MDEFIAQMTLDTKLLQGKGVFLMKTHVGNKYGRHVIIHLGKGELILECIESEIKRLMIQTGVVTSGIGSARKIVYHRIDSISDSPVDEYITVDGPTEIGAIQGLIVDGKPHLHVVCCGKECAFSGHMEHGCEVQYLAEISIIELLEADLTRKLDEFGITYIDAR